MFCWAEPDEHLKAALVNKIENFFNEPPLLHIGDLFLKVEQVLYKWGKPKIQQNILIG